MRIKIVVQIKMGGTLSQGNMTKSRKKLKCRDFKNNQRAKHMVENIL